MGQYIDAANERMVQLSRYIDEEREAARLQAAAIGGILCGGWITAYAIKAGFTPTGIAAVLTVGTTMGILLRAMD
jgi:hypothetical protein